MDMNPVDMTHLLTNTVLKPPGSSPADVPPLTPFTAEDRAYLYKDAIMFSGHKFLGIVWYYI